MDFDDLDDLDPVDVVDPSVEEREMGIVLYGATGYIGRLMVEHLDALLSKPDAKAVRWAVAGRNKEKLRAVARGCKTTPGIVQATDPVEISKMVDSCRVLLNASGPSAECGEDLVRECVNRVTHYVDVSSEVAWVSEMIRKYHDKAKEKGAVIVHCAGALASPHEILCYMLVRKLGPLKQYREYLREYGDVTGGFVASRLANLTSTAAASALSDPFILGGAHDGAPREADLDAPAAQADPHGTGLWLTSSEQGAASSRVLRRSCALFEALPSDGVQYGQGIAVTIREYSTDKAAAYRRAAEAAPPASCEVAERQAQQLRAALQAGDAPSPGSGPAAGERATHALTLLATAEGENGTWAHGRFVAGSGCELTAMAAVAGALVLTEELESLRPRERAGLVTPAFAFHGSTWAERLAAEPFACGASGPRVTFELGEGALSEAELKAGSMTSGWYGEIDGQPPPALPAPDRPPHLTPVQPLPLWAKPPVPKGSTTADVLKVVAAGAFYGHEFPFTLAMLQESRWGAQWLTKAFHAAGTLPADNSIVRIVKLTQLPMGGYDAAGGAAIKALMTVQYAKHHPELHTKLFVKVPFQESENMQWRLNMSMFGDADGCELSAYQFLSYLLPFRVPKFYFCDISRATTNYIIITEQVLFAKRGAEVKPYEIYPPIGKYQDYALSDPKEPYYALMRALGRMAAWDKQGRFEGVREIFENTSYARFGGREKMLAGKHAGAEYRRLTPASEREAHDKHTAMGALANAEKTLKITSSRAATMVNFVTDIAPWLFPDDVREAAFLEAFPQQMAVVDLYGWKISQYCNDDGLFDGLVHPNLQADNAYFWQQEDGTWDVGLFDWGGCGYHSYPSVFLGCVTTMLPDVYVEHEESLFRCFANEFKRYGGGEIDADELILRTRLLYCQTMIGMCINLQSYALASTPPEEWATIRDKKDDRVMGRWDTRCNALAAEAQMTVWRRGKHWKVLTEFLERYGFPYQPPWEIK